jgi:cell shape-determining protein MreC
LKNIFYKFIEGDDLGFTSLFLDEKLKSKLEEENRLIDLQRKKEAFLKKLDFSTDTSITKYISSNISFNDIKYTPSDLANINSEYLIDIK